MSRLRSSRSADLLVLWPRRDGRSSMAQSGNRNVRSRTTLDGPRWSGPLIAWVGFRHGGRLPELIVSLEVDPAIAGRVEPEECQGPYGGHWLPSADVAE